MCLWSMDLWTVEIVKQSARMPKHEKLVGLVSVCEYTYYADTNTYITIVLYLLEHTGTASYLVYLYDHIYIYIYIHIGM